jgi:hypothetical protein
MWSIHVVAVRLPGLSLLSFSLVSSVLSGTSTDGAISRSSTTILPLNTIIVAAIRTASPVSFVVWVQQDKSVLKPCPCLYMQQDGPLVLLLLACTSIILLLSLSCRQCCNSLGSDKLKTDTSKELVYCYVNSIGSIY